MGLSEFITPSIFMLKDGSVGSIVQLKSESVATKGIESIRKIQAIWHQVIVGLTDNNACIITEYRHQISLGINQEIENSVLSDLVEPQLSRNFYQQDLYITLLCKPTWMSGRKRKKNNVCLDNHQLIVRLEGLRGLVLSLMKTFRPMLLLQDKNRNGERSLSDVLFLIVNAGHQTQLINPDKSSFVKQDIGNEFANKQLLIGRKISYLGINEKESKFATIISIKRYPPESELTGTCPLCKLNFEWVRVHSFEPLSKESGMSCIGKQRSKLKSASDQALSQHEALSELEDKVAGESLTLGYHQYSVLVFADTEVGLEKNITALQACLIEQGYGCVREALGLEMAFWGMQAGGVSRGIRKALITSINFSHLCAIRGFSTGHRGNNHLGRPVCLLETQESMPYYFNFHVEGSRSNPSLGHTLILGASNSGKTVLLTYLDAMRSSLGGKRFFFDRDKGAYLYFKAIGGQYFSFDPSEKCMRLNPLILEGTVENRRFLTTWLEQMALPPEVKSLAAADRAVLRRCIDYAYDSLLPEQRYLSNALRILPRDYPYLENFSPWVRAGDHEIDGEFCDYFDNVKDTLSFSKATAFDMTYLLDQASPLLKKLVLMTVFHRIEQSCQGELVTITLDEGWQYFSDDYWKSKMKSWLPTLRKLNAHIVIATQSPSSIQSSGVEDIVLDNCPTQIYFGNEKANEKTYLDFLKLTKDEFQVIKSLLNPGRWMLLKHGSDSVVARLNMMGVLSYLPILSSNARNISRVKKILENYGDSDSWISLFVKKKASNHA